MGHPAIIRTGFASAEDAAKIYGVSLNHVKELRKLLSQFKTEAHKRTGDARKQNVKMRAARRAKAAAKRMSGSRKSRRAA